MSQVEFTYQGIKTIIQCQLEDKMKNIRDNYINKINLNKNTIYFLYNGKVYNQFDENLKLGDMMNSEDKKINKMNILVNENDNDDTIENNIVKSKDIICPKCKENIKMDIIDYRINLFGCKNGHKIDNILLNKFEETQNIDIANIKCDFCKNNNKNNSFNNIFYRCHRCKKNICPLCKSNHDHEVINYDDKDYICENHYEKFISMYTL